MKNARKVLAALLLIGILLVCLVGCKGGSSKFKVNYVGAGNIFGAGMFIDGTYQDETFRLPLDSFDGYTVTGFAFPDTENVSISGTPDGKFMYPGGIVVTLDDGSGSTRSVTLKTGDTFSVIPDGDSYKLVLP